MEEDYTDYKRYYWLEEYLFGEVIDKFQKDHCIGSFDFFCIIIWKANRAKSKIADRLKRMDLKESADDNLNLPLGKMTGDLDEICKQITKEIYNLGKPEAQLKYLLDTWGFRLPMASSILTVLYPDVFTVYDIRVCTTLKDYQKIDNISDTSERIWEYFKFVKKVKEATPAHLSLRDKDRYLWGKSFHDELVRDIRTGFVRRTKEHT